MKFLCLLFTLIRHTPYQIEAFGGSCTRLFYAIDDLVWTQFKVSAGRAYKDAKEKYQRHIIFQENMLEVSFS